MNFIEDDGYMSNGVKVFALNLQKIRPFSSLKDSVCLS